MVVVVYFAIKCKRILHQKELDGRGAQEKALYVVTCLEDANLEE